jgi:hypothetical protein
MERVRDGNVIVIGQDPGTQRGAPQKRKEQLVFPFAERTGGVKAWNLAVIVSREYVG